MMVKISTKSSVVSLFLDGLMENCEEIITIKDLNYNYLMCNNAFLKHFELKDENEVIGKSVSEFLPKDVAKSAKENIDKSIKLMKPQTIIFKIQVGSKTKMMRQTSTPLIKNGKVKCMLSLSVDITKDAILTEKLISKSSQLDTLLEYLPLIVYMKDKNKNFIIGSKYAKDFYEKGIDKYADDLKINMDEALQLADEEDNLVFEEKEILRKEKMAVDDDGNIHWYRIIKAPIVKKKNSIEGLITIARNIDSYKALENQKDLFIATLVHDLKNPLLAQISCINQCCQERFGELNDMQKEILSITLESANYMKDMLYTLINTYKYDNGAIQLKKENINIDKLVQTCIKEHKLLATEHDLKVRYSTNCKPEDAFAYVDEKQLRRVITNLLSNGIHYAYEKTDFDVMLNYSDGFFEITLENSGPQIDKETQEHLFEKYISESNKYQKVGFGLGLYLSKKIIDAHGGEISFEENNNRNRFVIKFPQKDLSDEVSRIHW